MSADPGVWDILDDAGNVLGAVVPHPRMEGYWMAMWKPRDWRDCGMKRYKTRNGATRMIKSLTADDKR